MFSSSKQSSVAANASDGGLLNWRGISPLTINEGSGKGSAGGLNTQTMILIAVGAVVALAGLWLLLRK